MTAHASSITHRPPNGDPPHFAHPSEEEFARLLDFYHIPWEYEPTSFVLERDKDGNVIEAFSPDFYLVDQDLYIELTTARQKLIPHKRRKIRRLQELYPDVHIKLINREDFGKMLHKYGLEDEAPNLVGTVDNGDGEK
ncbi:MAG: hypothetical protein Kow00120_09130 [Anaerolineae bacterium]